MGLVSGWPGCVPQNSSICEDGLSLHANGENTCGPCRSPASARAGLLRGVRGVGLQGDVHAACLQDEQKAEDELAKKRAAFLLKQQRKAEEARVRKQQLEAEVELKRDEAR